MSPDPCPVCGAPRKAADETCLRCSWDFTPVLSSDPRRLEERLAQAQKVWQAAMAYCADEAVAGNRATAPAQSASATFTNSLGMEFILIPAGSSTMGGGSEAHRVTLSQPFYLGKYPVTQGEWMAVMESNPSAFKGERNPVDKVSWNDVQTFIERLEAKEGTDRYHLPTEAEWEYAARAGTTSEYSFGDNHSQLRRYAWFADNSGGQTHPVGGKLPNPWGLYDMYGNVWEWVYDLYGDYPQSDITDPCGPLSGDYRVLRGGSWNSSASNLRSASRYGNTPDYRYVNYGFRLARSPSH